MRQPRWHLDTDLPSLRKEFPVLKNSVYLISNSLGAVPRAALKKLRGFYDLWAEQGVSAWSKEWWDLPARVANKIAVFLKGAQDSITMFANATQAHWVALSTQFAFRGRNRNKIVVTDQDFPSTLYSIQKVAEFMGWELDVVRSEPGAFIDPSDIMRRVDGKTLFVSTSHIYYKSAYIQDVAAVALHARNIGALSLIDGYHAPGCYPVDLEKLQVDFYVGGCLKWLCGGPGTAFLYIRPELAPRLGPYLTGWFAHKTPFAFSEKMEYATGSYRFMSGTPPIPCLYTASAGLDVLASVGIKQVRQKSEHQTKKIIAEAKERNYRLNTPEESALRGGAVSISIPHAYQVKQALEDRKIKIDFRKGGEREPDVIRIGPHFYTEDAELDQLFSELHAIYESGAYQSYPDQIRHVT